MSGSDQFFGRIKDNWRQRANERPTFASEFRVIPQWLVTLVIAFYGLALAIVVYVTRAIPNVLPDPLVAKPALLQLLAMFGLVTGMAIFAAAFILLIGYINRDARRRGMSPWLWTVIAVFVPYLVGVILYFVMREPLPFECPGCGHLVNAQFNFCPSCQCNLRPNCPNCRREIRPGDRFCPHCGLTLEAVAPPPASARPAESAGAV
ncbi:MAG TPA: zinc ribbon domain-containing protein [Terriglobia bacterium]|nr:zinc ribbon domain-containing protein [Terriglobia bacterium]